MVNISRNHEGKPLAASLSLFLRLELFHLQFLQQGLKIPFILFLAAPLNNGTGLFRTDTIHILKAFPGAHSIQQSLGSQPGHQFFTRIHPNQRNTKAVNELDRGGLSALFNGRQQIIAGLLAEAFHFPDLVRILAQMEDILIPVYKSLIDEGQ